MSSAAAPHFTTFGRYEIVRKLGRSMSDVYLARDPVLGRELVLKIVEQCSDAWSLAVAEAERRGATIQQQLHATDPRILEIYDVGEQNGSFYVAMQYAEGRSVAEIIAEKGRLDPFRASEIAADICSQLTSLHSFEAEIDGRKRAVIHGDIKPSNVQIGPDGEIRLLDFGIAKVISATRKLTHHDLGSPAYCSPERLNSSQVDPHSDLWALGVCLYEMVSGLPPYQAQTTRKLESVIQSRRPPRALPAECPRPLRDIIQKALAADASRRYASAQEFEADLRSFLAHRTAALAEAAPERRWHANETVERPRSAVRPSHQTGRRLPAWSIRTDLRRLFKTTWEPLLCGMLAGLFVLVPAAQIWRYWHDSAPLRIGRDYLRATEAAMDEDLRLLARLEQDYSWLRTLSPAIPLRDRLSARFIAAADQQFNNYRVQAGSPLERFDWSNARACLKRSLRLEPTNGVVIGKLALADGYDSLLNGASTDVVQARLVSAAGYLSNFVDPHLALARFYVYRQKNLGRALAEWHTAEKLGFRPGPREWEQEGDGYLGRVEATLREMRAAPSKEGRHPLLARLERDAARARQRYEPIAGFGRVSENLERLEALERTAAALEATPAPQPRQVARRYKRPRAWQ